MRSELFNILKGWTIAFIFGVSVIAVVMVLSFAGVL